MRDELSIDTGLLLKGTKVCIPPELLKRTLADLHGAHQGVDRMQAQAREAVYWPGIDADIADYVSQCTIAPNTRLLHLLSQCFLGTFLMAPGRTMQQTT